MKNTYPIHRLIKTSLWLAATALAVPNLTAESISLNLTVSAHDSAETEYTPAICEFDYLDHLPEGVNSGDYQVTVQDSEGNEIPSVVRGTRALWTLEALGLDSAVVVTLRLAPQKHAGIGVESTSSQLCVLAGGDLRIQSEAGAPRMIYHAQPTPLPRAGMDPAYIRGAYIHPLVTPGGYRVTEDYPENHIHHHGVWFPWTKTEFQGRHPDFWNMGKGEGSVAWVGTDHVFGGAAASGFQVRHQFLDYTNPVRNTVALDETWEVTVYSYEEDNEEMDFWMFDLVSTQSCATEDPLILPEYHYGGLGFRGREEWDGKPNAHFLTSYGERNRDKGNFTRGRWVDMSGEADGQYGGVTILCHPDNFRAPQPMRLHPSEPFMCYAPSQLGDWQIEPGQKYQSKYRFVVHDGKPDPERLEALWQNYAWPPQVRVK